MRRWVLDFCKPGKFKMFLSFAKRISSPSNLTIHVTIWLHTAKKLIQLSGTKVLGKSYVAWSMNRYNSRSRKVLSQSWRKERMGKSSQRKRCWIWERLQWLWWMVGLCHKSRHWEPADCERKLAKVSLKDCWCSHGIKEPQNGKSVRILYGFGEISVLRVKEDEMRFCVVLLPIHSVLGLPVKM